MTADPRCASQAVTEYACRAEELGSNSEWLEIKTLSRIATTH
jgi:hypothetical protein